MKYVLIGILVIAGTVVYLVERDQAQNAAPSQRDSVQQDSAQQNSVQQATDQNPYKMEPVMPAVEERRTGRKPRPMDDINARNSAIDSMANYIAAKGATIVDRRAFNSLEDCSAAVATISSEYQRRGIPSHYVADASAWTDMPGKFMAIRNGTDYLYLACITNDQVNWAAYIQFKFTEDQMRASRASSGN